jgi:3-hydroxybutyryl-CoA dehydrogenase
MASKAVGVIGAGIMGRGVAQDLAATGHDVVLVDISEDILAQAQQQLRSGLRLQNMFKKRDESPADTDTVMSRIEFSLDYGALSEVDFVIENVTEKWPVKQDVYAQIDTICSSDCIFAVNTSAIPITRIAALTTRPEQVIGTHFMNPVPMKKTVEVIRGYHTSDETLAKTQRLLEAMGKDYVVVNDSPGFVSNRVLMLTLNEAIFLVHEQVATAEEVDQIFKSCFGHQMGPCETADLIGLDTVLFSLEFLHDSFNNSKYNPCPLLRKMVDSGLKGRKNGKGFYTYPTML